MLDVWDGDAIIAAQMPAAKVGLGVGMKVRACVCVLFSIAVLAIGCSSPPEPAPPPAREMPAPPPLPASTTEPEPPPKVVDQPEPVKPEPAAAKAEPVTAQPSAPKPKPEPVKPSPPPEPPEPEPERAPPPKVELEPAVVDIGGHVEMAATKEGLTRIGVVKCKLCHKVQFASWTETAHAKRTPPVDCEDCHGAGNEYKGSKVMKDPEAARAAGMVIPDRAFCAQCHKSWNDDLLTRTHAHKEDGPPL